MAADIQDHRSRNKRHMRTVMAVIIVTLLLILALTSISKYRHRVRAHIDIRDVTILDDGRISIEMESEIRPSTVVNELLRSKGREESVGQTVLASSQESLLDYYDAVFNPAKGESHTRLWTSDVESVEVMAQPGESFDLMPGDELKIVRFKCTSLHDSESVLFVLQVIDWNSRKRFQQSPESRR